ncbi:hypothetical protein BC2230_11063 [Burkholderia cepacia]
MLPRLATIGRPKNACAKGRPNGAAGSVFQCGSHGVPVKDGRASEAGAAVFFAHPGGGRAARASLTCVSPAQPASGDNWPRRIRHRPLPIDRR